jgi:tagatose 6-phosphate kinase
MVEGSAMHILCVTPNVSIDRTLLVPGFAAGEVWRAEEVHAACGGKGVNVARAVVALGHRATCAGMLGGHSGRFAAEAAATEGLDAEWTWTGLETRTCVIIVGSKGAASVVNEPGCAISAADWERFVGDVAVAARTVDAVCISGSLPPGTPEGGLRDLIDRTGRHGCPVWLDASGAALAEVVAETPRAMPAGIKINAQEAAVLVGQPIASAETAAIAAETIRQRGPSSVAITLGAAGAVLVSEGTRLWARPPALAAVSAVGSGDCFLAGLMAGWQERGSPEEALLLATAAGAANALGWRVGFSTDDVARLFVETTLTPIDVD